MSTPDTSPSYLLDYCERAGDPAFWAEPLNAVTNLAFIIGAVILLSRLRSLPLPRYADVWGLILSMIAIGIGSGLWHTHATSWTVLADVIPIYIFINIAIFSLLIRLLDMRFLMALLCWGIFQAINVGVQSSLSHQILNGSLMYIPTYGLLMLVSLWLFVKGKPQAHLMMSATITFTISLTFRTIDNDICDQLPIGTHFLWHICNAYVLYQIVRAVSPAAMQMRSTGIKIPSKPDGENKTTI